MLRMLGEIAISDGPLLVMLTWKTQLWEALIASLYDERSLVVGTVLRALLPVWWLLFLRVEWVHFLSLGTLFKFWYLVFFFNNTFFTFRPEIHSGGNTFSMFHIMKCHITWKVRGKESLRLFGSLGKGSDRPKKEGGLPRQHYHFMAREPIPCLSS